MINHLRVLLGWLPSRRIGGSEPEAKTRFGILAFAGLRVLAAKIDEVMPYQVKPAERTLADIITEMAGLDTVWDPRGYRDLVNFSNNEFRDYFLSLTGERVIFCGRRVIERIPDDLPPESATALRAKRKSVFDEIAARNSLTRFQVEYFVRPPAKR